MHPSRFRVAQLEKTVALCGGLAIAPSELDFFQVGFFGFLFKATQMGSLF